MENNVASAVVIELVKGAFPLDLDGPDRVQLLAMFECHALELRGMKIRLDLATYEKMWSAGRIVLVVARYSQEALVGYAASVVTQEPHYGQLVALDDGFYVCPELRGKGLFRRMQEVAVEELKRRGVQYSHLRTKHSAPHDGVMAELGYHPYELVYRRDIR